jgi:hypothetical protein
LRDPSEETIMKTLDAVRLIYRRDPSSGVPKLTVERGSVPSSEVKALEADLAGQYEHLARQPDHEAVTLRGRTYCLQVLRRESRIPELVLDEHSAENGQSEAAPLLGSTSWTDGFLTALVPFVRQAPDPRDPHAHARAALCFTLEELRSLGQVSPDWLALLLTTGYLLFRKECCQELDPSRGGFYALALCELERLLEERGSDDPSLPAAGKVDLRSRAALESAGALGWLKRSFQRLFPVEAR